MATTDTARLRQTDDYIVDGKSRERDALIRMLVHYRHFGTR
jgi:hypothetical protein